MNSAPTSPDVLIWLDVETTGLHAGSDLLLEVAALATDTGLNLLDPDGFQAKILHPAQDLAAAKAGADPFVRDMHEATGLWDACADPHQASSLQSVQAGLMDFVRHHAPSKRQGRLAGNSVRLDANFLDAHLSGVAAHLHYRTVDVSAVAFLAQQWAGVEPMVKKRAHTAMSDIRESIAELQRLRAALRNGF